MIAGFSALIVVFQQGLPVFDRLSQGIENEASVIGRTLAGAPAAIWDELSDDFQKDYKNLLKREAASLGIGAAGGLILSRSQILGRAFVAIPAAYFGLKMAHAATSVVGRAWDADSEAERDSLVSEASRSLGREAATTIETMPAFLAGGAAGMAVGRNSRHLDRLAFAVAESAEFRLRGLLPERVHWRGPGTEKLPASIVGADGQVNMVRLTELLAERHSWSGVEVGRSISLAEARMSRAMKGTPFSNDLGFHDVAGRVTFHTHPPLLPAKGDIIPGARPSLSDLAATAEVGIIRSGRLTTIFKGERSEIAAAALRGEEYSPVLRSVVLDRENRLAVELQSRFSMKTREFEAAIPRTLDYDATIRVLSRWDRKWSTLESIPTDHSALASPLAARLLRLGL